MEKYKVSKLTSTKTLAIYFLGPILLGFFLGHILGINISSFVKEYVGIFRFVESIGKDIHTTSLIFFIAILFSPLLLLVLRQSNVEATKEAKQKRDEMSVQTLFFMILGSLLIWWVVGVELLFGDMGFSGGSITSRLLRSIVNSDILFSFILEGFLYVLVLIPPAVVMAIREIFSRLKKLYK